VNGFLVDDAGSAAARIAELLHDPGLRERMGDAARERVRERFLSLRELEDYLRLAVRLT
jgi:trehalose synthase